MRPLILMVCLGLLAGPRAAGHPETRDASALLAAARQALGGDAALSAVATLTLNGSITQTYKSTRQVATRRTNFGLDVKIAFPHQYVRGTKYAEGQTAGSEITEYRGFNGSALIRDTLSRGLMPLESTTALNPKSPQAQAKFLVDAKHAFVLLTVPLFAASFAGSPVEFSSAGRQTGPSGPVDVIVVKSSDNYEWRLSLDADTHLPVAMTGRATPVIGPVVFESMATEQEWKLAISDYRVSSGLKWPRKLTSTLGPDVTEEMTLDRFALNPKIDPKVFNPNAGR